MASDSSGKCRWYFTWFENLSVDSCLMFSRPISDHYTSNSHLLRINIEESNLFDCGETYQDIDRIVFNCKHCILPREKLVENFKNLDFSVRDILEIRSLSMIEILYIFFNDIRYIIWYCFVFFF